MSQIHAAASCRKQRSQPRPARPTYLRLWRSGDCAVHAFDTPDAFERCARRPVPMAGENTPPRPPRSDDKAERMIIVRGPRSKPGAVRAAKMAEMCEFGEHRPPPFPRPAVGRRANNDRLKPGRNSLVGDRAAIVSCCWMTSSRALRSQDHRSCYCPLFLPRCSDYQTICKYSSNSRAVRPTINNAKCFVGTRGVRG